METEFVLSLGEQRWTLPAESSDITIGRASKADIRLQADDQISRIHARLSRTGTTWTLHDESRNGTGLNGRRITGPTPLSNNDRIHIGRSVLTFHVPAVGGGSGVGEGTAAYDARGSAGGAIAGAAAGAVASGVSVGDAGGEGASGGYGSGTPGRPGAADRDLGEGATGPDAGAAAFDAAGAAAGTGATDLGAGAPEADSAGPGLGATGSDRSGSGSDAFDRSSGRTPPPVPRAPSDPTAPGDRSPAAGPLPTDLGGQYSSAEHPPPPNAGPANPVIPVTPGPFGARDPEALDRSAPPTPPNVLRPTPSDAPGNQPRSPGESANGGPGESSYGSPGGSSYGGAGESSYGGGSGGSSFGGRGESAYSGSGESAGSGTSGSSYSGPGESASSGAGGSSDGGPGEPGSSGPGGSTYSSPGGSASSGPGGSTYSSSGGSASSGAGGSSDGAPGESAYGGPGGPSYGGGSYTGANWSSPGAGGPAKDEPEEPRPAPSGPLSARLEGRRPPAAPSGQGSDGPRYPGAGGPLIDGPDGPRYPGAGGPLTDGPDGPRAGGAAYPGGDGHGYRGGDGYPGDADSGQVPGGASWAAYPAADHLEHARSPWDNAGGQIDGSESNWNESASWPDASRSTPPDRRLPGSARTGNRGSTRGSSQHLSGDVEVGKVRLLRVLAVGGGVILFGIVLNVIVSFAAAGPSSALRWLVPPLIALVAAMGLAVLDAVDPKDRAATRLDVSVYVAIGAVLLGVGVGGFAITSGVQYVTGYLSGSESGTDKLVKPVAKTASGLTVTVDNVTYTSHFTRVELTVANSGDKAVKLPLDGSTTLAGAEGQGLRTDVGRSDWPDSLPAKGSKHASILFKGNLPDGTANATLTIKSGDTTFAVPGILLGR